MSIQASLKRGAALVLATSAGLFAMAPAQADVVTAAGTTIVGGSLVFDNFNGFSVGGSYTTSAPVLHLAVDTYIAEIDLYQVGNVVSTEQLGLTPVGGGADQLFASLNTMPFLYDVYTYVHYAAVNTLFAAGDYTITNLASGWAANASSDFVGFAQVYAAPAPAAVPEPASLALVGVALGGLALSRRRAR